MISFILSFCSRYPKLLIGSMALTLLLMVLDTAALLSVAPVVALLVGGESESTAARAFMDAAAQVGLEGGVEVFLPIYVAINITTAVVYILIDYFLIKVKFVIREDLVADFSNDVILSSINFVNKQRQGDFLNSLTHEINRVGDAFTAITRMVAPIAQILILLAVPIYLSWNVTLITMAAAVALTLPFRYFRKKTYQWGRAESETSAAYTSVLQETFSNVRLISTFAKEQNAIVRIRDAFKDYRAATLMSQLLQIIISRAYPPIGIVLVLIAFTVSQHLGVPLAELAVVLYAFHRLAGTLGNLSSQRYQFLGLYPAYEAVNRMRQEAEASRPRFGDRPAPTQLDHITLDHVTFSYPDGAPVLNDVSIDVRRGELTALVGASGAGKSTTADILLGLQLPTSGAVLVNGTPLCELDIDSYKRQIGYVPQQNALFHATIRANILWANPDATEGDIIEACRLANAYDFIVGLENGLDTVVGDRGVRLSGGQLQRIALARALVRRPSILVLDEATSALDTESENLIQEALKTISERTAVLAIAHRLSTVRSSTSVYVLENGRVIEHGSFNDLASADGHFARLVDMQRL
tara:strand:- start:1435 stop:3183 length:1749 start_codon:yes stop_codon:yes gene_type:complete